jgi:hypothetical protein
MCHRILPAVLIAFALFPASAWAQGYGGSLPPPAPQALAAGAQNGSPYGAYPPLAQVPASLPVAPSPSDVNPAFAPAQGYPSAPAYQPPPAYIAAPGPGFATAPATAPATDGTTLFPTGAMPTLGSRWMFTVEAIWLQRIDSSGVILGNTVTDYGSGLGYVTEILTSTDVNFPLDSGVRLQVGYRFTDQNSLSLSYFGLQQSSVGRTIYGDPVGNTVLAYSPWTQTDAIIGGFDNSLGYTYGSRVNNAEINQRIVAAAGPTWTLAGLWGVRFVQIADKFNLNGSDISTGDFENLDIRTANNLLGPQIGADWTSYWNRFQLSSGVKAGLFANFDSASFSNLNSSGVTTGNPAGFYPIDQSAHGTNVAGLLEFSLMARYRVTEHVWLLGGYQTYYFAGLALGPRQLASFDHSGAMSLSGPSLGLETNW